MKGGHEVALGDPARTRPTSLTELPLEVDQNRDELLH